MASIDPPHVVSSPDFGDDHHQRQKDDRRRTDHGKGDENVISTHVLDHKGPRAEAQADDEKGQAGKDEVDDDGRHHEGRYREGCRHGVGCGRGRDTVDSRDSIDVNWRLSRSLAGAPRRGPGNKSQIPTRCKILVGGYGANVGWWCLAGAISGQGRDGRRACVRDLHDSLRVSEAFSLCQDTTLSGANQDEGAELTWQGGDDESDGPAWLSWKFRSPGSELLGTLA